MTKSARANISVCMIVRDDETSGLLDECLASVRPHVAELVVVDTGSSDNTIDVVRRYADIVESFTACNDPQTGAMADFASARNRSFDLATKPWVMWIDSDDILAGGEHLARLVAIGDANRGGRDWCYLFPYEYVYDQNGRCVCLHYRERLVSRRSAMWWVNPVHEVMIPTADAKLSLVPCDDVVFKHQRQRSKKRQEGGRNLRILQQFVEVDGSDDARQWYYLGLEYANAGKIDQATHWLSQYVSASGWDDEKTMALLKLAELCYGRNQIREGLVWAFRAIETRESWGEGYIALARGFFSLALMGAPGGDVRRNWEKCAHFARLALTMPPTKTMLFVNPQERALDVHVFLTMALSQLGDARGALHHAEEAFKVTPDDPNLVYNKRVFERMVAKDDVASALNRLVAAQSLSAAARDAIVSAIDADNGAVGEWLPYERPDGYPRNVEQKHFPVAVVTPHARAFGIPESTELDDLPVIMTDAQVEAATLLMWREYILHDEVMAAERLLADAPYRAKHSVAVQRALERTRAMTAWMTDASSEQAVNTPEDPTIENGVPLPGPLTGALAARADMARSGLRRGERVLDLGCFDGGIVNRWALDGLDVTGVDLCAGSIALAQQKADEFSTGARFMCAKFADLAVQGAYDVVTCCDTYEHVRDPVKDLIAPARRALTTTGRMIVVTPHGAWMRGQHVPWAHPWRWADDEGRPWNTDLPHAHLVAPTPWTVADQFQRDGWTVRDSYVVLSDDVRDVAGQGNVYTEAHVTTPPAAEGGALDVVFACGDAWEQWTPLVHRTKGIGGSETMVVELAKRLARAGHRVRVYTSTGKDGEGIYDGVEYRQTAMLELARECDVLIAWRNAAMLETDIQAKVRLLWVHDIYAGNASHRALLRADRVLALSEWHRNFLATHHNLAPEQMRVTRNGIDLARFDEPIERNAHKAVYSSSPDRGLPVLLDVWPTIRARVPDAELHVFYGFANWRKLAVARGDDAQLRIIDALEARVRALANEGVVYRGKVDQTTLAREFCSAGVWCSPTWFTETSCQLAGTLIFTKDGMKNIEDIKIGDHVLTHKGRFRSVTALLNKQYIGPLYSVKRKKDFRPIVLTAEHPLYVKTIRFPDGDRERRAVAESWKTPAELESDRDYLFTPKMEFGARTSVRLSDYVDLPVVAGRICRNHRNPQYKTPEDLVPLTDETMFIFGLFAADGCASWLHTRDVPGPITFAFHARDRELMARVHAFFGEGTLTQTSANGFVFSVSNGPWSMFLRSAIGVSRNKRIPPFVWECPEGLQRAFVAGMFAGDGNTSTTPKGNAKTTLPFKRYTSISPSLTYGMAQLLANLGEFPGITYSAERDAYTMHWTERQICAWHQQLEDGFATRVESVTCEHYEGTVYNFEVDEDSSYVTDRTVVHNCISAMEAQAAGLRIVTSAIAALNETVGDRHGVLLEGDWLSADYQERFIGEVIRAMVAPECDWVTTRFDLTQRARRDFGLDALASDWIAMMREEIERVQAAPLVPYMGRADFTRAA